MHRQIGRSLSAIVIVANESECHARDDDADTGDGAQNGWYWQEEQGDTGEDQPRRTSDHTGSPRAAHIRFLLAQQKFWVA
jgi:hypothetical protein